MLLSGAEPSLTGNHYRDESCDKEKYGTVNNDNNHTYSLINRNILWRSGRSSLMRDGAAGQVECIW